MTSILRRTLATCALLPALAGAQGVRVSGVTSIQLADLRPFDLTTGRQLDKQLAAPLFQDVLISGWGLGEGVRVHAHLRFREQVGGTRDLWPRSDDRFDPFEVYAELDRQWGRVRLGRQFTNNGFGIYNFDGGAVLLRPRRWLVAEGWAGRSLVAGLSERYTSEALAALDDIPPSDDAIVAGGRVQLRHGAHTVTAAYQREARYDRGGLYSERVALDGRSRVGPAVLDLDLTHDLATGEWNEARVRASLAGLRRYNAAVEVRHYVPFFPLWTIWGVFSPVGFDEARVTGDWRSLDGTLRVGGYTGWRKYGEPNAGFPGVDMRNDGWRAGAQGDWRLSPAWSLNGSYGIDIGFGASRSDGAVGARWTRGDDLWLGAQGTAFQNIYEFRVGTGRVLGIMLDGGWRLHDDLRLTGDVGVYRHRNTNGALQNDWSQQRASVRLEWTVGSDPGTGGRR